MPVPPPTGGGGGVGSPPFTKIGRLSKFFVPFEQPPRYRITGTTRDSMNAAVPSVTVEVFETGSGLLRASTVSDSSGNYSVDVTGGMGLTFFAVGYLPGSPDIFGTTINTLVGS